MSVYGKYEDLPSYMHCGEGKDKSHTCYYVPVIPRLQQLFDVPQIAKMMTAHAESVSFSDPATEFTDMWGSPSWKRAYEFGLLKVSNSWKIVLFECRFSST
jgi:hypothetical protein